MISKKKVGLSFLILLTMLITIFSFSVPLYADTNVELDGKSITVYRDYYKINNVDTPYTGILTITNTGVNEPNITIKESDVSININANINFLYLAADNATINIDSGYTVQNLRTLYSNRKKATINATNSSGVKNV